MNPNLGASARALQDWLLLAREGGIEPVLCLQKAGALSDWLTKERFEFQIDFMPTLDRWNSLRWAWSAGRQISWLRGRKVNLIHCYEHDLWTYAWPLRNVMRVPAICHIHSSVRRTYAEWAFGNNWRRPNYAIWVSQKQRADRSGALAGIVPADKQAIVPLGLDLSRFGNALDDGVQLRQKLGVLDNEILVVSACALRPGKRIEDFIELSKRLLARGANVKCLLAGGVIAGDRQYGEEMEARLRELAMGRRFHWLGHVEPVEPVLQAADIVVSTSEYETFGMSICEAMACSRPVVAYRGGAVKEVVGDAGLVVETGDLDGLTAAVERLVVDRGLRNRLGHGGRQRVAKEFNPRKSFDQLRSIYEGLVGRRKELVR